MTWRTYGTKRSCRGIEQVQKQKEVRKSRFLSLEKGWLLSENKHKIGLALLTGMFSPSQSISADHKPYLTLWETELPFLFVCLFVFFKMDHSDSLRPSLVVNFEVNEILMRPGTQNSCKHNIFLSFSEKPSSVCSQNGVLYRDPHLVYLSVPALKR